MLITLEAARRNIGYSQKEAADLFGIHYQTLAKLEEDSSNAPFAFIQKIPKIYKIPTNNIFFGSKKRVYSFIKKPEGSRIKRRQAVCMLSCSISGTTSGAIRMNTRNGWKPKRKQEVIQMTRPKRRTRYRWGRIALAVVAMLGVGLGIASGVKALIAQPEYVEKVVVVDENETLWDICSKINDDREDVRVMIDRAMDRNHITDAGTIQPGQKLLIPVLKEK